MAEYSTDLAATPRTSYLTTDHLGSPGVVTDQLGTVVSRHDYTGFGKDIAETLGATTGGRTSAHGYGATDELRKQYTGYERDEESGLEFAQARYYNGDHGRFTSTDPLTASADIKNPQTFNRYSYVLNSPYKYVDPLGLISSSTGACGQWCQGNDGGAVGWTESYDSGHRNGWERAADLEALPIAPAYASHEAASDDLSFPLSDVEHGSSEAVPTPLGYGRLTFGHRQVIRERYQGLLASGISGVITDITIATVVYSDVPTGESSDGTVPAFPGPTGDVAPKGMLFVGDVRGHIIAAALGGRIEEGTNLFSQSPSVNNGAYRTIENGIRRTLTQNQDWTAQITVMLTYNPPSHPRASERYRFRATGGIYSVVYFDSAGRITDLNSYPFRN